MDDVSWKGVRALGLAVCLLALPACQTIAAPAAGPPASALQELVDKAAIEDLFTRYYYNLNRGSGESFAQFFTDDAELVTRINTVRGRDQIVAAFEAARRDNPLIGAYSLNIMLSDALIVVHGDTATARATFAEIITDKEGEAPRVLSHGREYTRLVKQNGQWRMSWRNVTRSMDPPEGWTD